MQWVTRLMRSECEADHATSTRDAIGTSSMLQLLVTANVVPGSLILLTLTMKAINFPFLQEPHDVTSLNTAL
jgi:hypothetical protein